MAKKNEIVTHNQELAEYRSQFVIYPEDVLSYRRAPYAFTEQGVAMLLMLVTMSVGEVE